MEGRTLSVIQLNEYIKNVFEDELILHDITLYGEIYQIGRGGSNVYLTLKEGECLIQCLHFGALEPTFSVGDKVKLFGTIKFFTRGGKLNFIFKNIQAFGSGALRADFLRLKEKLEKEGLFDRKQPLPALVSKIALITSETGAVLHDFLYTIHRYRPFGDVDVYSVTVQGVGAADAIACAVEKVNRSKLGYDVLVVARGGGSSDELDAFNTERVARAIAKSRIPTVSAVGHETDFTLCDFCASVRAGTPSIAGEMIADINLRMFSKLNTAMRTLVQTFGVFYEFKHQKLLAGANKMTQRAELKTSLARQRLKFGTQRLISATLRQYNQNKLHVFSAAHTIMINADSLIVCKHRMFSNVETALDKNSPLRILSQGYARLYKNGSAVLSVRQVEKGDKLDVFLQDGTCDVTVNKTKETN